MSASPATPHSPHPQHTGAGGGAAFDLLTVGDTALCAPAVIAAQVSVSEWEGSQSVERWSSALPTDPLHTIVLDSTPRRAWHLKYITKLVLPMHSQSRTVARRQHHHARQ